MIKTENLCMSYGPVQALADICFEVKKGEVIGLLGPNGAGKSTTLKIITTYIYPTSGTAYVGGKDVREDTLAIRKMIGYLPEQLPLYMDMEVEEYLRFVANSRGIHGALLKQRMDWVKDKCGLKAVFRKMIRQLSKGYRQRTALAQALIHDPELVILDEPTSGLDPHQILEIRDLIKELASHKTIIFSTHILQEVQAVTNRVIIINRGKIVANSTTEKLQEDMGYRCCELILPTEIEEAQVLKQLQAIDQVNQAKVCGRKKQEISYEIKSKSKQALRQPIAQMIKEKGWDFLELKQKSFSLEDIFLAHTEPEKSDLSKKGVSA